jgi:uncharacterized RDD family membrane protein YckC
MVLTQKAYFAVPPPPPPPLPPPPSPQSPLVTANYATLADRFVTVLIDSIITAVVAGAISAPLGFLSYMTGMWFMFGPATLIGFLLWIVYYSYFESTSGQTIGKIISKIKVVDERTFEVVDIGRSIIRNILRIVDFLPFFYIIGIVVISTNPMKQRLGDIVARTIVVRLN